MFTAVPERPVVFVGTKGSNAFQMKSRVVYPMEGGTALVTFEDEAGEFLGELITHNSFSQKQ